MLGIPVLLAILALAGAPQSTHVTCNPEIGKAGFALPGYVPTTQPSGGIADLEPNGKSHILLGVVPCQALAYAAGTRSERARIRSLNPFTNYDLIVGIGLVTVLHEAEHVAMMSGNECLVEKAAHLKFPQLDHYADHPKIALAGEIQFHNTHPANYLGC